MPTHEIKSQELIDNIEELVHRTESIPDPHARGIAVDLVQAVLQFHAIAIDRLIEIAAESSTSIVQRLAADDLVSSMLLLHDLHPDDVHTRVERAVEKLGEMFGTLGAKLSLVSIDSGTVRLLFESSRPWSGTPVRASVESAIVQAAPEIDTVIIDGLKEPAPANFVPVSDLLTGSRVNGSHVWTST